MRGFLVMRMLIATCFLLFSVAGNRFFAQVSKAPDGSNTDSLMLLYSVKAAVDVNHSGEKTVSGVIVVPGGNVASVNIKLLGNDDAEILSVKPDRNGNFRMELDWSKRPASLWIYTYGYVPEKIWLRNQPDLKKLKISLLKVTHTNSLPPVTE